MKSNTEVKTKMMYVSFCDILGFSNAIENNFEDTVKIYLEFKEEVLNIVKIDGVSVSIYSDAIIVVGKDFANVVEAVKQIYWFCLLHDLLIRGGLAYGKHWSNVENGSILILSEALVEAVKIEKSIKHPIIAVSEKINIPIEAWMPHCEGAVFNAPFINYDDINFVNPFNAFWFRSAEMRLKHLLKKFPNHSHKYEWLLNIIEKIKIDDVLIPDDVFNYLLEKGVLTYIDKG